MDFTLSIYKELLKQLISEGYRFQTFKDYLTNPTDRFVILRHDVDLLPQNSLRFAKIQYDLGLKGSFYFRMVPESWDEDIIVEIEKMGHEIGYHYETMDTSSSRLKRKNISFSFSDLVDAAYEEFQQNLQKMRKLVPVDTICMHGSPRSPYDNKEIWKEFDYKDLGIIGEPYFDVDFNQVFYLTDTGRRWDGFKVSVRDKVDSGFRLSFHSTKQIIEALKTRKLPDKIMFTFHPQRWHDNHYLWLRELVLQNAKKTVKIYLLVKA